MLKTVWLSSLIFFPTSAFAGDIHQRYADGHLIVMAFLTGFAMFALVQIGYVLIQTFNKAHIRKRIQKKRS